MALAEGSGSLAVRLPRLGLNRVVLPLAAGAFGVLLLSDAIHPLGLVLLQIYLAF